MKIKKDEEIVLLTSFTYLVSCRRCLWVSRYALSHLFSLHYPLTNNISHATRHDEVKDKREVPGLKTATEGSKTGRRPKDILSVFHHRNSTHQSYILNTGIVILVETVITNHYKDLPNRYNIISVDLRVGI